MSDNSRARMEEIKKAAAAIVERAGGAEKIISLPEKKRRAKITELRKRLEADTNCFRTVSLRHIKAAVGLTPPVGGDRWNPSPYSLQRLSFQGTREELGWIRKKIIELLTQRREQE